VEQAPEGIAPAPEGQHGTEPMKRPFPGRQPVQVGDEERGRRVLEERREQHEALQATRREQGTEEFRSRYAARAGIEGTHGQAIRRCGLRRCRYIGVAKAHLQHLLTAAAINLVRLSEWWAGTPLARTRCSRFAALQPAA